MKLHWFTRKGFFFLPASLPGWLLVMAIAIYAIWAFLDIDSQSHSASDTLINFFFQMLIVGAFYSILAYFTSEKEG